MSKALDLIDTYYERIYDSASDLLLRCQAATHHYSQLNEVFYKSFSQKQKSKEYDENFLADCIDILQTITKDMGAFTELFRNETGKQLFPLIKKDPEAKILPNWLARATAKETQQYGTQKSAKYYIHKIRFLQSLQEVIKVLTSDSALMTELKGWGTQELRETYKKVCNLLLKSFAILEKRKKQQTEVSLNYLQSNLFRKNHPEYFTAVSY